MIYHTIFVAMLVKQYKNYIIHFCIMETITFQNNVYPKFQTRGNASQFSIPFAKYFCKGYGYDIGYCKDEWKLPNAIGIDINDKNDFHANYLPIGTVDYIYSSHCLEHVDNWIDTLD